MSQSTAHEACASAVPHVCVVMPGGGVSRGREVGCGAWRSVRQAVRRTARTAWPAGLRDRAAASLHVQTPSAAHRVSVGPRSAPGHATSQTGLQCPTAEGGWENEHVLIGIRGRMCEMRVGNSCNTSSSQWQPRTCQHVTSRPPQRQHLNKHPEHPPPPLPTHTHTPDVSRSRSSAPMPWPPW